MGKLKLISIFDMVAQFTTLPGLFKSWQHSMDAVLMGLNELLQSVKKFLGDVNGTCSASDVHFLRCGSEAWRKMSPFCLSLSGYILTVFRLCWLK